MEEHSHLTVLHPCIARNADVMARLYYIVVGSEQPWTSDPAGDADFLAGSLIRIRPRR